MSGTEQQKRKMTPEEIKKKIEDLQKRHEAVVQKKAGLGGQLQAKKDELAAIVREVKEAGYDPNKLPAERDKAQQELETMVVDFETKLIEVEQAVAVFDKK